jgi:hypothetical protein
MRKCLVLAILALLLTPAVAFGQAQKGTVTVTAEAEDGSRLPGATVSAESDQTLSRRTAITDANGVATLAALDPAANYVVTTTLDGFNGARNENVVVKAGQTTPIRVTLSLATVTEEVIVTAESPVVDVTSAATGQDITLELTESLPTARSYQDYLQLVPGVQATSSGNPASRSGVNYSDIGGVTGNSTDNFYYFEGINVTDNVSGTFGANINTEIIQEQSVLTGGLPAEFVGATGLVSNVVTKSGGNQFSGSVNYYFQDDGLVADSKNDEEDIFSTFDSAATIGGPIVRDKAWFFGSFRTTEREADVFSEATSAEASRFLRTVTRSADQGFGKVTWSLTQSDLLSGTFLSDPQDQDGSFNSSTTNLRDTTSDQGGDRYTVNYTKVWNSLVFDAGYSDHSGDLNTLPANLTTRNDINFRGGESPGPAAEQLGGSGTIFEEERGNESFRASLEYLASSSWGDHTLKGGLELSENQNLRNFLTTGDGGIYNSLDQSYAGQNVTAGEVANTFQDVDFNPNNTSDYNGLIGTINSLPNAAEFYARYDLNGDGTISQGELASGLVFNSSAGNPNPGYINYDRIFQVNDGAQFTKSEGTVYYLQDNWQWNKWSVNLGVRAEGWDHFSSAGEEIFAFDTEYAPRVSVVYDLKGDGRHRLSAYFGRYYDPIRNNMTNFAGSVTGRERDEQVFINDQWVTYRTRGGPTVADAFFAPTTQTPFTDELQIGYKVDLGRNQSFEINLIDRQTEDILEDYDLSLYADPDAYGLPIDHPESLFLGLGPFGFTTAPEANFFIATLVGGQRDWQGLELIYRKRMSNNWQVLASYNYADAEGNTNSDSNADFQGDVLWLDPRAINQNGTQPGLVEHLFKVAATYQFNNGLSVGGTYRWNSGVIASRTFRASGRNLPLLDVNDPLVTELINFAGQEGVWLSPFAVGQFENDSYGTMDLRLSYLWRIGGRWEADFFVDLFNVFDDQAATRSQNLVSGLGGIDFGEGIDFVSPRRFFLGARLRF